MYGNEAEDHHDGRSYGRSEPVRNGISLDLIRTINKEGITVLFIEHVMKAVVSVCTRAIVLNQGKLLCEGEPRTVLNDPQVVAAYLGGEANVTGN